MAEKKSLYKFDNPDAAFAKAEDCIYRARRNGAKELNFSLFGLTALPTSISELTELEDLDLAGNHYLRTLPSGIGNLLRLRTLNLTGTDLRSLPASIGKLANLRVFNINSAELTALPDTIGQLSGLQSLYLHDNELLALPESIGQLSELEVLCVGNNHLTFLPESLGHLKKLRFLHLTENRLITLPESIRKLTTLEMLYLHGNAALGLPREVLGEIHLDALEWDWRKRIEGPRSRPAAILDYYFRIRTRGERPLHEAKLILLGRGEVGKTCVVNRLVHNKFKSTKMTKGIAITQWPVTVGKETVRLHVWDFGGQEIQHATHQFFLTERSLYLVVLNGRAGDEENDAEYWLKFVKTFGASSPTIVVLNKFKVQPFQVNRRALQEKYPFIRAVVETDCKPNTKNGRAELIKEIESAIGGMEHVRAAFPADWFRIKERLAEMKEPFISFDEYRKICVELGEKDATAQERLAGFLDDLGIALNFREDQQLREETVLNPHWITEGVYQIITSKALTEGNGELRLADLKKILPPKTYPVEKHQFLIELMRKFELCFSYHDDPAEHRYLVPELLGKEKPALKEPFPPEECLNFRYDYRLMPEGLLPRFITRTHTMSEPGERWRTGVVLRWEGCRALVEADKQERQVIVRVLGEPEKRTRLLAVIRQNFDEIHKEMKEFKPAEWVALEEHPEEWVNHKELEVFEKRKESELRKQVGEEVVSVNVAKMLGETDVPRARREERVGEDGPLKLFISYAHEDERWRAKLAPNLGLLQREGLIEIWSDQQIVPGMKWDDEIKRKLEEAELYLFLMSTHLLTSDYVCKFELPAALKRYEAKKAGFVPVVVQRCSWKPYVGEIQVLPTGGKAVSDWRQYDHACFDVESGLRKTITEVKNMLART